MTAGPGRGGASSAGAGPGRLDPDHIPSHQLGYVLPVQVGDFIHYQFYRACPPSCLLVCKPLDLGSFTRDGAEKALEQFWPAIDFLAARKVHRISQGGLPISAYVGRPRMLDMIKQAQDRTGLPCTADFEESIDALKAMGVGKVAIGAKWDDALMSRLEDYLAHAGLSVVGHATEPHSAAEVIALGPERADLALELGRAALSRFPEADGLLLGGGAWLSMPAIPVLEAEFGKPVINNPTATYWAALRQFGVPARRGFGRLLDSLSS